MTTVNNITRMLDARGILYTAHELPVEKLGAMEAAQLMGVPAEKVFKTIVILRDKQRKPVLAVVPGPHQVDLKQVAHELGERKVYLPTEREAEQLTGLQAGGISPLALLHKGFLVLIDSLAQQYDQVYISGGQRGLNIEISPEDLSALTNARFYPISQPKPG